MITMQEEARIIERCRKALRKQGKQLSKKTDRSVITWRPGKGRYRITAAGARGANDYPLSFQDVLQAAGVII